MWCLLSLLQKTSVWKLSGGLWCTGTDAMWVWWWADSHASVCVWHLTSCEELRNCPWSLLWEWCWQLLCSSLSQCTNICMNKQTNKQTTTWTQTHSQHLTAVHSAHRYPQLNRLEILHFIWFLTPCKNVLFCFVCFAVTFLMQYLWILKARLRRKTA